MFALNHHPDRGEPLDPRDAASLDAGATAAVEALLALCPAHRETPLLGLPVLAAELGLGAIQVKDESQRFGLNSFKALGGVHAVIRLVLEEAERRLGRKVRPEELRDPPLREIAASISVGCATAGNHGRAVAAGAKLTGCRAVVFVPTETSERRAAAIAAHGAEVRRVAGSYDEVLVEAGRICAQEGWSVVSDTSWPGYERIPRLVMQGYTAMVAEALLALDAPPSHVLLQAGVGGFAAAVAGHLCSSPAQPRIIVVEPERAACLFESHRAGHSIRIAARAPTAMATLACYEPSMIAWRILTRTAAGFLTITEEEAGAAAQRLRDPRGSDPKLATSESGAAGLAGLLAVCHDPAARAALGLDLESRILLFNTEGDVT